MPTPDEWVDRIWDVVAPREYATATELELIEEALREHPHSSALWCLRGDLIQMSDDGVGDYALEDALTSYERAAREDPEDYEAWESIGFYLDAVQEDPVRAEAPFRRAVELDGERDSWMGLAGVLAQQGKTAEALRVLEPGTCPFANDEALCELRREIEIEGAGPAEDA